MIAPTLLADLFPVKQRGRAMGLYYLALPVGTALGYMLGRYDRRCAGMAGGLFGCRFARAAGRFRRACSCATPAAEPSEGGAAGQKAGRPRTERLSRVVPDPDLPVQHCRHGGRHVRNRCLRGLGPVFYQRVHGLTAPAGRQHDRRVAGRRETARHRAGNVLSPTCSTSSPSGPTCCSRPSPCCARCPWVPSASSIPITSLRLAYLFGASVLLSMVLGPCNTVTANVVPANRRAAAYAAFIFLIHLFGDISSPILLGWISDFFGEPKRGHSPIGKFFASIGAGPVGRYQLDRRHALGRARSGARASSSS